MRFRLPWIWSSRPVGLETISTPAYGGCGEGQTIRPAAAPARRVAPPEGVTGGVDLRGLGEGTVLEVSTRNSVYRLQVGDAGRVFVTGHAEHCPELVEATAIGSVMVTGVIYDRYVAPGMRMELKLGERRVFTSRVVGVRVVG
jgi:hypothetical protein